VQKYREEKFMLELQMVLNRDPLTIKRKDGSERKFSKLTRAAAESESEEYTWDMIGGYEEEKKICQEIEQTIRNYVFMRRRMKKPIPRGIIFHGPPGTGKTTFAKIIACQAGVPFEYISRQDVASTYKDGTPQKLAEVYAKAKSYITKGLSTASVVIIDEADSILAKRDGREREHSNEISVVLTEMDGKGVDGLITIAATNRKDILDPAILRPGRFERDVYIGLPDQKTRVAIFRVILGEHAEYALKHNGEENFLGEIDYKRLAQETDGLAGAHIRSVVERAVRNQCLDFVIHNRQIHPLATDNILKSIEEVGEEKDPEE
jgi:cell division protease FtsH